MPLIIRVERVMSEYDMPEHDQRTLQTMQDHVAGMRAEHGWWGLAALATGMPVLSATTALALALSMDAAAEEHPEAPQFRETMPVLVLTGLALAAALRINAAMYSDGDQHNASNALRTLHPRLAADLLGEDTAARAVAGLRPPAGRYQHRSMTPSRPAEDVGTVRADEALALETMLSGRGQLAMAPGDEDVLPAEEAWARTRDRAQYLLRRWSQQWTSHWDVLRGQRIRLCWYDCPGEPRQVDHDDDLGY